MEPLQHDPRTKQQVKEALYQFLYGPVQKRYQEQLHQIIVQNTLLIKGSHASFIYKNEFYSNEGTSPPRRMNRLHSTLVPTMEATSCASMKERLSGLQKNVNSHRKTSRHKMTVRTWYMQSRLPCAMMGI